MTKICDKCHKNPAVVHVRAILLNGKHETSSYCLPCALSLIEGDNPPPGLKEMLEGVKQELSSLKLLGTEEIRNLMEGDGRFDRTALQPDIDELPKAVTCPYCHTDWGRELIDENVRKCGHCLSVARGEFREKFGACFERRFDFTMEVQGLPNVCTEAQKENHDRLLKLLKCYHEALDNNREEGAELLRQEIIGLRQEMTDQMRSAVKPLKETDSSITYLTQGAQGVTCADSYEALLRNGWLPFPNEEEPQIRLASGAIARRTMVDLQMPKDASASDYHEEIASRLMAEPIFKNGYYNRCDGFLASENKRLFAKCGGIGLDGRRAGYFEMVTLDSVSPYSRNLECLDAILKHLECSNNLFFDPEFGYFHPERNSGGSGITVMEFLHLPALLSTIGLPKLRKIVGDMDGGNCLRGKQGIRLEPPWGWFKMGRMSYITALGGFIVLCDTRMFGVPLHERYMNLRHIAASLEKHERAARRTMRSDRVIREEVLDDMARSYSMLRDCRIMAREDAIPALSNLWLGHELGCYPAISKGQLIEALKIASTPGDYLLGIVQGSTSTLERIKEPLRSQSYEEYLSEVLWEDQDLDAVMKPDGEEVPACPVEIFSELPCNMEDFRETVNESFLQKPVISYAERRKGLAGAKHRANLVQRILFKS